MAYNEGLAGRVRKLLARYQDLEEKKMFGGLCFMLSRHMCCGVTDQLLMIRVRKEEYEQFLGHPHVREMDFTGKPLRGMLFVEPEGIRSDNDLRFWLEQSISFVKTLPPK